MDSIQPIQHLYLAEIDLNAVPEILSKYCCDKALKMAEEDPKEYYIYACPAEYIDHPYYDKKKQRKLQYWPTIGKFNYKNAFTSIRNFIRCWRLDPSFTVDVIIREGSEVKERFGTRHPIEVEFYKPIWGIKDPPKALVHFNVFVSAVLLKYFPVMVSYIFEGDDTEYFARGSFMTSDMTFQAPRIEAIITRKLQKRAELEIEQRKSSISDYYSTTTIENSNVTDNCSGTTYKSSNSNMKNEASATTFSTISSISFSVADSSSEVDEADEVY